MSTIPRRNPLPRSLRPLRPSQSTSHLPRRTYTPAPTATSGPLLSRRADRALPALASINNPWHTWRHAPLVAVLLLVGGAAVFNYEKLNHSVVGSSLYALRVHPRSREVLGDEVYFAQRIPWIWGSIDPMHGCIDVRFGVKGSRRKGMMRFRAVRGKGDEFVSFVWGVFKGRC
jgi:cytochrome c oxidase assembly factor 1